MEKGTVIGVGVIICDIDVLGLVFWRERGKDRDKDRETRTERRGQRQRDEDRDRERERERRKVRWREDRQATSYHDIAESKNGHVRHRLVIR